MLETGYTVDEDLSLDTQTHPFGERIAYMIETIKKQVCIPVISSMKKLEQFLKTELEVCVLQDVHIAMLGSMIGVLHEQHRKALVHIDMINGISSDEYGTEFIVQKLKADGIISVKARVIEATKKNHRLAILRMFLIDSKSVERGIDTIEKAKPDMVEVMPAIAFSAIEALRLRIEVPIIAGGLIKHEVDIDQGLSLGCDAFSLSDLNLCAYKSSQLKK